MLKKLYQKLLSVPDKTIGLTLFLSAFLFRLMYGIYVYLTQPEPAKNVYYEIARLILEQKNIFYFTGNPYYESAGPVIPWINALTMLIFGKNYLGLYIITSLASALLTLFTWKTARLFLDKPVALLAGFWSVIYIFYYYFTPTPGKDIWMGFFMIFLMYCLINIFVESRFSYPRYLLFIIMFAISFHVDERYFVFTPFLGLFILGTETEGFKKLNIGKTLLFAVLTLLLLTPWTIRNYRDHHKIVLLSTRTSQFTDRIFGYEPTGHLMEEIVDVYGVYYINEQQYDSVITGLKTHTDMGRKISPEMVDAMKKGKLPGPLTGIRAFASRLRTMFEPFQITGRYERTGYFYYQKSLRHNIATFLFYGVILIFSIPGFIFLYKGNRKVTLILLAIIIIYGLTHGLSIPYTNWRYRLPLDAIFIMVGCSGLVSSYRMLFKKVKRQR